MGRVQLETHDGHRIVVIDCRNCSPAELMNVIEQVQEIVTSQPLNSVHTLTDFSGAQFDRDSFQRMKEAAALDRPHIIRAAFIGIDTLPDVYHKGIENFSARRFATFQTKAEALAYLTEDGATKQSA